VCSGLIVRWRTPARVERITGRVAGLEAGAVGASAAGAYAAARIGGFALAVLALALVGLQYLVAELLTHKRRGRELERMAAIDELTGLANRETFKAPARGGGGKRCRGR